MRPVVAVLAWARMDDVAGNCSQKLGRKQRSDLPGRSYRNEVPQTLKALIQTVAADLDVQSVLSGIRKGMREQMISGLAGSSRQVLIAALEEEIERPMLVVTHNMFSAQKIAEDLQ